jgi:hypothetical protein
MIRNSTLTTDLADDVRLPRPIGWGFGMVLSLAMWAMILAGLASL